MSLQHHDNASLYCLSATRKVGLRFEPHRDFVSGATYAAFSQPTKFAGYVSACRRCSALPAFLLLRVINVLVVMMQLVWSLGCM